MKVSRRISLAVVGVALALFAFTAVAVAVTHHKATKKKTFMLSPGKTATYDVAFPFALKYGNASYACKAKKLQPKTIGAGQTKPKLKKVKIISKEPALGGSLCRVKVANNNASATAPVRIKITTTTRWTTP